MYRFSSRVRRRRAIIVGELRNRLIVTRSPDMVGARGVGRGHELTLHLDVDDVAVGGSRQGDPTMARVFVTSAGVGVVTAASVETLPAAAQTTRSPAVTVPDATSFCTPPVWT
jgi:hypothetical protein